MIGRLITLYNSKEIIDIHLRFTGTDLKSVEALMYEIPWRSERENEF